MDYELFDEWKWYVTSAIETKNNPVEVVRTLTELINYVAEFYLEEE